MKLSVYNNTIDIRKIILLMFIKISNDIEEEILFVACHQKTETRKVEIK